ncbi:MAG: PTS sugar transporter subunit IIBC, partial [Clostridioides difficile]|nr:PTS sugar transporter subunit IIBC [Clostridioides difficile]
MNKKIVAVCESERSLNSLKTAANDLGFDLVYEIQENDNIKNELSIYDIEDASIVLFVTSDSIESIEKIDRFIDREFYEVDPKYIIEDAKS